jgi:hypothetical protein
MDRELEMTIGPVHQTPDESQKSTASQLEVGSEHDGQMLAEQALSISEIDGKPRSAWRLIAILVALFVRHPSLQTQKPSLILMHLFPALSLCSCLRRHNRSNCRSYHLLRLKIRSRLYLDRRSLFTRKCSIWSHLGQIFRHLGTQSHYFVSAGNVLYFKRGVCYGEDYGNACYWASVPGDCGGRVDATRTCLY